VTAGTDSETTVFTERDRQLLSEIHAMLKAVEPYLPMLERARTWLDRNPAARWRQRHAVPQDDQG
jgi:hypothetical protein